MSCQYLTRKPLGRKSQRIGTSYEGRIYHNLWSIRPRNVHSNKSVSLSRQDFPVCHAIRDGRQPGHFLHHIHRRVNHRLHLSALHYSRPEPAGQTLRHLNVRTLKVAPLYRCYATRQRQCEIVAACMYLRELLA